MSDTLKRAWLYGLLLVALAVTLTVLWFTHLQTVAPIPDVGVHVLAKPAQEVRAVAKLKAIVKPGAVTVYDSPAKIKLNLPDVIKDDPDQHVIAANQVKADDHPQTVTTVINAETGESQTFVRRDPLPWLALDDHGQVGLYAGVKNGLPTARLEAQQGIFQVKALHVGVVATVDQPMQGPLQTDYYVGAGAWYRW